MGGCVLLAQRLSQNCIDEVHRRMLHPACLDSDMCFAHAYTRRLTREHDKSVPGPVRDASGLEHEHERHGYRTVHSLFEGRRRDCNCDNRGVAMRLR